MPSIVLDASALLALLLGEPGAEAVRPTLAGAAMSTVNLAEVAGHYARHGVDSDGILEVLAPLPIDYVAPDAALAHDIGLLVTATRGSGLSLGDRACLALARRLGVPALTADRRWLDVAAAIGAEVRLIC
jgi:PIN domain nuclease of toxin-antitoxin system